MKDLTQGPVLSHALTMAAPIFAGLILVLLCGLIDLYFIGGLGEAAIAGVGAAGNTGFVVSALTQVVSAGTLAAVSHSVGRKDQAAANLAFNQSLGSVGPVRCLYPRDRVRHGAPLHEFGRGRRSDRRGRDHLPSLVHAGARAAIRDAGDVVGAARHRHRQADDVCPGAHGHHQHHSSPRAHPGLGDRSRPRRRGEPALPVASPIAIGVAVLWTYFQKNRQLSQPRSRAMASANRAMDAHPQRRPSGRRRVRDHVRLPGRRLLCARRFWPVRASRLRHRFALARADPGAGHGACFRRGPHHRAEFRRGKRHAGQAGDQANPRCRHRRDDCIDRHHAVAAGTLAERLYRRSGRRLPTARCSSGWCR